ncbi:hypothetical protein ACP4OV_010244 [Aristida adscensionis]
MAAIQDQKEQPLLLPTSSAAADRRCTSSEEGKQPPQPPEPAEVFAALSALCVGVIIVLGGVKLLWPLVAGAFEPSQPAEYAVTIAAVSGLDPDADLQVQAHQPATTLEPAFNLTLRVASPAAAFWPQECVRAGTAVEVSYLRSRVPLAAGPAPELCVARGEERTEGSVVAWGTGVRLPAFVRDSLAADLRRGTAEFGVRLTGPPPSCGGGSHCSGSVKVVSCWAKIGVPAPCNVTEVWK